MRKINIFLTVILCLLISCSINSTKAQSSENVETIAYENLVGYFDFNDKSNLRVLNRTGLSNAGVMNNMTPNSYTDVHGNFGFGRALKFDGVDDYVEIPNDPILEGMDEITVSAWVKPDETGDDDAFIVGKHKSGAWWLSVNTWSDDIQWQVRDSEGNTEGFRPSVPIWDGEWHLLTCTWDGEEQKVFVDGELIASTDRNFDSIQKDGENIDVGGNSWNRWFSGSISEIKVYNKALSASEIKTLHKETGPILEIMNIEKNADWTNDSVSGYALDFNGINEYVETQSLGFSGSFSALYWFKPDIIQEHGFKVVSGTTGASFNFYPRGKDIHARIWNDNGKFFTIRTSSYEVEEWMLLTVVLDTSDMTWSLYKNEKFLGETSVGGGFTFEDATAWIGWNKPYSYARGKIDDIRIYNQPLATSEIESLQNREEVKENLIVHFPLDEGIGEEVYDQSSDSAIGRIFSPIRVRENTELLIPIQRTDQELAKSISEAKIRVLIDGIKFLSKTVDPKEIKAGGEQLMEIQWFPEEIGKHEVEAVLEYGEVEISSTRTFDVDPPLNPPLESLDAFVSDTGEGLEIVLNPVSAWDCEESDWNTTSEVKVYFNKLLRNRKTLDTTYSISGSPPRFTIPYDKFYEGDGNYTVEIEFLGENVGKTVGVAGKDGVYDPPNELAWLLSVFWIGVALALAYVVKSHYSK